MQLLNVKNKIKSWKKTASFNKLAVFYGMYRKNKITLCFIYKKANKLKLAGFLNIQHFIQEVF